MDGGTTRSLDESTISDLFNRWIMRSSPQELERPVSIRRVNDIESAEAESMGTSASSTFEFDEEKLRESLPEKSVYLWAAMVDTNEPVDVFVGWLVLLVVRKQNWHYQNDKGLPI